jgi:Mg2+-importing ATPase
MNKELINKPKPSGVNNVKGHPSPLPELCACAPEEALVRLEASKSGLTEEQVEARLDQYGPNEVTHEKPPTWYQQLFHAFLTPFNGVLFAVSVVSLFSDVIFAAPEDRSFRTIIVLITMILLSTLLRFWQEFRSNKAAEELKAMVTSTAAVLRAGMDRPQELPISSLVPGDSLPFSR